ncbi:FHA domain-containing protein, partial [Microbacterium yannicii]|uniref:FHA domain-containing protein n=1 Tax=Microbacterium yannicii TaxID=671622 RepID=UPI00037D868F
GMTLPLPAATTTEPLGPQALARTPAPASAPAVRSATATVTATATAPASTTAPATVAFAGDHGVPEDIDATRLTAAVPPPAQRAALYPEAPVLAVLTWDDGTRMAVYGRTLYGRNPAATAGAVAIPVRDETLSLSKTHFEVGGDADGAWIVDRHSTNGTVLVRDGSRIPLVPGLPTSLRTGDRLEFGDRTAAVGEA